MPVFAEQKIMQNKRAFKKNHFHILLLMRNVHFILYNKLNLRMKLYRVVLGSL